MPVSRRHLLGAAAALAAAPALAACGGGTGGGGARMRVAFPGGGTRESLDPHVVPQFVDQARARACFDTLTGWSQQMTAQPRLAESIGPDATGTRWRIRLRDTTWHDGRPLTGEDVLFTLRRLADDATSATAASLFATVDHTASTARGRDAEIVLSAPNFLFPLSLGAPGTEIVPAGTTSFGNPIGTGPFRFVSFEPGGPAVYARNDAYWDGAPPAPELEFTPIDDEQARLGALLSGQVAYAHDLRPASARQVEQQAGRAVLLSAPQSTTQFLNLRVDRPPFSDPRVREAVRIGIDREALVRIVLLDTGRPGNDLFGGPDLQYFPTGVPQVTRDVARARALLREAGAENVAVELQTSGSDANFGPAATLVAEQLTEIGLRATPRTLDSQTYFVTVRQEGVSSFTRTGTLPIPDYIGRRRLTGSNENQYTGYREPEIDRLYAAAVATPDEAARTTLLERIQTTLRADSGALVWGTSNWNVGIADGVTGVENARPNSLLWARFDKAAAG
ncbi:ABC transporter substrate-binding protein [Pseudonocardia alni]|uniref:Peptide/nickel transport system substrate-binding protein n=1 Tax=Pseudonocardia alni TaxID=33907 RepID=A0AA44UPI3_PSEA5|nr:ABC transporter substrate-binding protein [Pseudonocardia alni]PKB31140.1 peptide/nickel transport system substrate-binding protein [Pseudonocardia alni]